MRPCSALARTVGRHRIVGVLAVGHGIEAVSADDLVIDGGEERVLAVEAAVCVVASVLGELQLARVHLDQFDPEAARDVDGDVPFAAGQAGRDPEERDDVARAQCAGGDRQQHGRVDATAEGHTEAADAQQLRRDVEHQLLVRLGEQQRRCVRHQSHALRTSLRSPDHSVWKVPSMSLRL